MADFTALKTAIQNAIKQNGNEEITGNILQGILLSIVTTLGDSAINDLITALGNEVNARQQADGTLQQNITDEATARGNADTALSNRLGSTITAENTAADQIAALQGLIDGITENIENGYVYAGIATPSSTPATGKVFYLALTAGTYTNFGSTVVSQGINILKYNGSTWSLDAFIGIDDTPTPNSPKLVKSGGAFNSVMANGSAFDISAHFALGGTLATYADLSAALTALGTLSADYKRGGMSIKFVQSSDNNYVQARLMADSFTTDVTKWQTIEDEPAINSKKLVKSGGIEKYTGIIPLLIGENVFNKANSRVDKSINSDSPYQILSYTANKSYLSDFIEIPEDANTLIYNGLTVGVGIRFRFSMEATDNGTATKVEISSPSGILDLTPYKSWKYIVFWVYRSADTATVPTLDSVNITFNTGLIGDILKDIETANGNIGELQGDTEELQGDIYGDRIIQNISLPNNTGLNKDGSELPSFDYCSSDYISVNAGDVLRFRNVGGSNAAMIAAYTTNDASGFVADSPATIGGEGGAVTNTPRNYFVEIPDGINYVRFTRDTRVMPERTIQVSFCGKGIIRDLLNAENDIRELQGDAAKTTNRLISKTVFSSVMPRMGTLIIQMDCNSVNFYPNKEQYAQLLQSHGINSTYNVLMDDLSDEAKLAFLKNVLLKGDEISMHTTARGIPNTSQKLSEFEKDFGDVGISIYGGVVYKNTIHNSEVQLLKDRMAWIQPNTIEDMSTYGITTGNIDVLSSTQADAEVNPNADNAIMDLNDSPTRIRRLFIEQYPAQQTSEINTMIVNKVKNLIDNIVENKKVLVLYAHSYNMPSAEYTLMPDVLSGILQYADDYIKKGLLISGTTIDSLNYYYSKRFNE